MSQITMKSEISVELVDSMGSDEAIIRAAKVSTLGTRTADEMDKEGEKRFIDFLMKNRHGTPFEHGSMTFRISAPIFVFREWHRHRIGWSYNEESARYREMEPVFYIPRITRPLVQQGKPGAYTFVPGTNTQWETSIEAMGKAYATAYAQYEGMLANGVAREIARTVLPVGIYSTMYATANPRSIMAFLSLRTKDANSKFPSFPQWEIEQAALQVEHLFKWHFPLTAASFHEHGRVAP